MTNASSHEASKVHSEPASRLLSPVKERSPSGPTSVIPAAKVVHNTWIPNVSRVQRPVQARAQPEAQAQAQPEAQAQALPSAPVVAVLQRDSGFQKGAAPLSVRKIREPGGLVATIAQWFRDF